MCFSASAGFAAGAALLVAGGVTLKKARHSAELAYAAIFSHVLWPIYVPFAVLLLEPVRWRRRALVAFLAAGAAVGLYLLASVASRSSRGRSAGTSSMPRRTSTSWR